MISDCPDVKPGSSDTSNDFRNSAVLYTGNIECYTSELTQEAENCVVLDCKDWYKFGGGKRLNSKGNHVGR